MVTNGAKRTLQLCRQLLVISAAGFLVSNASAARLGHPQYSASGATPAQKQWNLLCDPTGAVSGSTSTQYSPTVAALDTITAVDGMQIDEVDVAVTDGEVTYTDQFILPAGTTSFVIVPAEEEDLAAAVSTAGTTYYASLDGSEVGAVQVFWAPFNSTPVTTDVATAAVVGPQNQNPSFFRPFQSDVNTHVITFDSLTTDPRQVAIFTNYANGSGSFPVYFDQQDSYSGPGFTYTAGQIFPQTTRLFLYPPPPVCQRPPVCPKPILIFPKGPSDRDRDHDRH
jgi:hypothetical protein